MSFRTPGKAVHGEGVSPQSFCYKISQDSTKGELLAAMHCRKQQLLCALYWEKQCTFYWRGFSASWQRKNDFKGPCPFSLIDLQSQQWLVECFSHLITLILTRLLPYFTYEDPCDNTGPMWIIQDYLPISR